MVPVIRLTGDVAKMAGYPVGLVWRILRYYGDENRNISYEENDQNPVCTKGPVPLYWVEELIFGESSYGYTAQHQ